MSLRSPSPRAGGIPDAERTRRHQRAWYWYDWANSAYVTTTATVLLSPYLTAIAKEAACPGLAGGQECRTDLRVLGVPVAPGSLAPYTVTLATIVSAVLLIVIGAIADRSPRPTRLLAGFALAGATAASGLFLVTGSNWQLGVILTVIASLCLGGSLVVYDALLVRIAGPDDRDRVSSRGWALGYLGGGLLLAVNLWMVSATPFGWTTSEAARWSMLSAGVWWALFTLIPVIGLWDVRGTTAVPPRREASPLLSPFIQLADTFREIRLYPMTLLFLAAYLFYNDGIQTVIGSASLYGTEELRFSGAQMMVTILLVQFVAFGGALLFGALARRWGARRTVIGGLGLWTGVVAFAFFVPAGRFTVWLVCAVLIGLVMGGTQALSRSLYSQLVPRGRESEFFGFYQAMERGTSWFGTLTFGLVYQFAHSYRLAIIALVAFFLVGGVLLMRVDIRRGIREAGNEMPRIV